MESPGGAHPRPVMLFGVDLSRAAARSVQEPPRNLQERRSLFSREPMQEQHDRVHLNDPWTIKKKLTKTDVDHRQCRLLLPTARFEEHILGYLPEDDINSKKGISVEVLDGDTRSLHGLCLKRWASESYVLIGGWHKNFVLRRHLNENDEIGLFWNPSNTKFHFRVLTRAAAPPQNPI